MGIRFHPAVVVGLGYDFLFKSLPGHCEALLTCSCVTISFLLKKMKDESVESMFSSKTEGVGSTTSWMYCTLQMRLKIKWLSIKLSDRNIYLPTKLMSWRISLIPYSGFTPSCTLLTSDQKKFINRTLLRKNLTLLRTKSL